VSPPEKRVPLIDPGEPPPPPPPDLVPLDEDEDVDGGDDEGEVDEAPARPSSGRRLPVGLPDGRTLDGEIIDRACGSMHPHAFRSSGIRLIDL
jgi:hypothetical protein